MARARSQSLVIDASIARAAGPEGAAHPTAKRCRDFLLAILEICHRAVFTPEIQEEWNRHQSGFARSWRVSMFARKKIDRLEARSDEALRQHVQAVAHTEKERDEMLKDVHLIEAALAKGERIATLDESARDYFRIMAVFLGHLGRICWVNPDVSEENALQWLRSGAPADDFRMLGHVEDEE